MSADVLRLSLFLQDILSASGTGDGSPGCTGRIGSELMIFLEELEAMRCAACQAGRDSDDMLFMHSRCHPTAATWMVYAKGSGAVRVQCSVCDALVVEIAVAPRCDFAESKP